MKEDAARVKSELKIIATKMPLVCNGYNYLNENRGDVLKRRSDQLVQTTPTNEFLDQNAEFQSLVNDCEEKLKAVKNEEALEQNGSSNVPRGTTEGPYKTNNELECEFDDALNK
ncbi:hypothetical protein Bhyg_11978 [Pseudolycoriella hygida]|uniref:Uncharacterized protein n=1 Tax=Pseudolycoriella hygida TaxID=35572 RepID=A0A9Q0MWE2_9DIPT|nr:hypothetical protein Bhyg_11978 [Pseudolycoriella hygida]